VRLQRQDPVLERDLVDLRQLPSRLHLRPRLVRVHRQDPGVQRERVGLRRLPRRVCPSDAPPREHLLQLHGNEPDLPGGHGLLLHLPRRVDRRQRRERVPVSPGVEPGVQLQAGRVRVQEGVCGGPYGRQRVRQSDRLHHR